MNSAGFGWIFSLIFFYHHDLIFERERERESMSGAGAERERDRGSKAGSVLAEESPSQTLNRLSHPGAPVVLFLNISRSLRQN